MSIRTITQDTKATHVAFESGLLRRFGPLFRRLMRLDAGRVVVVTDQTVRGLYGEAIDRTLTDVGVQAVWHELEPGEGSKSLESVGRLYGFLADSGVGRDGVVIALGGGVVSDVAGFAAGTWMRGVRFAVIPTTLEGMIDAAIGGKTAVNTPAGKNLAGVFHPPALAAIDPGCLVTLPARVFRAGLAESVKHAALFSEDFLAWHERELDAILALEPTTMVELIDRNVEIKGGVVSRDPWETTGERAVLNFGHTIGHAIEAFGGLGLLHGECVSLGMVAACRISERMGLAGHETLERIVGLLERIGLPTRLPGSAEMDRIVAGIGMDKKRVGGRVRFVLLEGIGSPVIREGVSESMIVEGCGWLGR